MQWLPMTTEIREVQLPTEQLHVEDRARLYDFPVAIDRGEAIGTAECRDAARPLSHGIRRQRLLPAVGREKRTRPTRRYSVRPISLFTFTASRAGTTARASADRPASRRNTGATNSWNVKMAEVGNPGNTTTGLRPVTARHIGLPGLSATPCATMPGSTSSATTRCETSPAPLLVPQRAAQRRRDRARSAMRPAARRRRPR